MPLTISSNASGSGTFIVQNPASASNRTLTLPDATTTLVGTDTTQTLTNKTLQGGALTQATAVASTSGTAIDFTGIPSWAKRVTVMFSGVSTSGTSGYLVQLGTSGGVTSTGYTSTGNAYNQANATGGLSSTAGFIMSVVSAAAVVGGHMTITNVTGNTWVSSHSACRLTTEVLNGGGFVSLSNTLDRVRITTVNGTDTFDAGTINIMWEG